MSSYHGNMNCVGLDLISNASWGVEGGTCCSLNNCIYCKRRNIHAVHIFTHFVQGLGCTKI